MKKYDVIVIGSGAGLLLVNRSISHGLSVALVDRGPLGGTCLNLGCIPSKMLILPADRIMEIKEAAKLGIYAKIEEIDFAAIDIDGCPAETNPKYSQRHRAAS
jgi:mycothione reductase